MMRYEFIPMERLTALIDSVERLTILPSQQVSSTLGYEVGDTVSHVKFGNGVVTQIRDGGRDKEVTVEFERFGVKKMFAGFAKLVKV